MSPFLTLFSKELTLELRRRSVLAGIGLYLVSLTFICYLTFALRNSAINETTWSALFWVAILFSVVNSVAKSFIGEKQGLLIYYYQVASPQQIVISKIVYNALLSLLLSSVGYGLFSVFIGDPVQDKLTFAAVLVLTSIGFSAALTLISGIASRANNSNILMAVLSFPVVISILLLAIKATKNALDGLDRTASSDELLNLLAVDCIMIALSYLLFPYIWRS